jgi:hypothetical protein
MAPDLNSMDSNGRWDYSTPGSGGYDIPNIVYNVTCPPIEYEKKLTNSGSIVSKTQGIDGWSRALWDPDGVSNSKELRECGARDIREECGHWRDVAGEQISWQVSSELNHLETG